jgi:uncharacterized protein involved in exopolysaccharide biosynthesis
MVWTVFAAGAAAFGGFLARKSLETAWRQIRRSDPPLNPVTPKTTWTDALLWGAAAGLVAGLSRVVMRRSAFAAWHRVLGRQPPEYS